MTADFFLACLCISALSVTILLVAAASLLVRAVWDALK